VDARDVRRDLPEAIGRRSAARGKRGKLFKALETVGWMALSLAVGGRRQRRPDRPSTAALFCR
jgi:hypothetical protein